MAWNYDASLIDSSGRSWVRFRVGDTSSGSQLVSDEEIDAVLNLHPKERAAAFVARSIGAYFARKADKRVGRLSISMAQTSEHYFDLADDLDRESGLSAKPYAGGISVSDVEAEEADTDRPERAAYIGQFDNLGAVSS